MTERLDTRSSDEEETFPLSKDITEAEVAAADSLIFDEAETQDLDVAAALKYGAVLLGVDTTIMLAKDPAVQSEFYDFGFANNPDKSDISLEAPDAA